MVVTVLSRSFIQSATYQRLVPGVKPWSIDNICTRFSDMTGDLQKTYGLLSSIKRQDNMPQTTLKDTQHIYVESEQCRGGKTVWQQGTERVSMVESFCAIRPQCLFIVIDMSFECNLLTLRPLSLPDGWLVYWLHSSLVPNYC